MNQMTNGTTNRKYHLRKRLVGAVAAIATLGGMLLMAQVPISQAATAARVMTNSNLRSGPGTNYAVNGSASAGSSVTLSCYQYGGGANGYYGYTTLWYKTTSGQWIIDSNIYTGSSKPVTAACSTTPTPAPTASSAAKTARVMTNSNLRTGPGTNYAVNGSASAGSNVTMSCFQYGGGASGYYGYTTLWYKTTFGQWIIDSNIYTGSSKPVTAACSTTPPPATPTVAASGKYNTAIVAAANKVGNGATGGKCATWVETIVLRAGGPSITLGPSTVGYQTSWAKYASLVYSSASGQGAWSNVQPGDIVQWQSGDGTYIHTAIILSGTSASTAQLIDSNYVQTNTVYRGTFANRNAYYTAHQAPYMIWRVK